MNVLSLFSGIGGLELGLERAGMTTVGQVELDPFCRQVLAKHWPEVPRHDDVRTAVEWWLPCPDCGVSESDGRCRSNDSRPVVDVICGGFPCQDISNAGRRAGIRGERSGLWSYMARTVRVLRPRYVVMENVATLVVRGLDVVAGDLAEIGYDLQWDCIPAAAVGANHRRDRWFGVAYPNRDRVRVEPVSQYGRSGADVAAADGSDGDVADSSSERCGQRRPGRPARDGANRKGERPKALADTDCVPSIWSPVARQQRHPWDAEPALGRVVDGIPYRVVEPELRALGNAVVPQVAEHVGRLVMEFDAQRGAAA